MKKKKESFYERLLKKNADQNSQGQSPKKRKSWKAIVISSALIAAIATGITVPIVINTNKKTYDNGLNNNVEIITYEKDGKTIKLDIENYLNFNKKAEKSNDKEMFDEVERQMIFYLYEKEQVASAEFETKWNDSKEASESDVRTYKLPTIAELKDRFTKELNDIQNNLRVQYGNINAETEFNKLIATEQYGNSKSFDEAVDHLIFEKIKTDALRRFKLSTKDLSKEITRKNASGEYVFPWWHSNDSLAKFIESDGKYLSLATESFVFNDSYKSAVPFIKSFVKNKKPYLISEFVMPGIVPNKVDGKWAFDKEMIKRYMYYSPTSSSLDAAVSNTELIKTKFKPFSEYVKKVIDNPMNNGVYDLSKEAVEYSTIQTLLSQADSNTKNNWGTNGLITIEELFTPDNLYELLAIYPQLLDSADKNGSLIKEIDLFAKFDEIRTEIETALGITKPDLSTGTEAEKTKKIIEYNTKIFDYFKDADDTKDTGFTTKLFESKVVEPLSKLFTSDDKKVNTVYKITGLDNVRVILTSKGIKMFYFSTDFTYENILEMIKNDFIISNRYKSVSGAKYNVLNKINTVLSSEEQLKIMLEDTEFITYLKEKNNPYSKSETGEKLEAKYTDKDIEELKGITERFSKYSSIAKFITMSQTSDSTLKTKANEGINSDLKTINNVVYFAKNNDNDTKGVTVKLVEFMQKLFNLSNEGGTN
ncbi:Uncharacterised protein [Mycoplasmopsis maculosa]|uniref:Membrane protein P80 n=1 Tax=Mycoplasmopsis maculosa TaxID=114885 RepID=A0A449B4U3_9BACT|nr:hypothetical protein [Mycoplasmopsis maculosa]VEU75610.1 Uncharacterised protein [Mycoplasmopsis maculosa]